jgi:hypothetical protein
MTHKEATDTLKQKYPDAETYRPSKTCGLCKKGSIAVVFKPYGKVYTYRVNNYRELLEKLGCNNRRG